MTAPALLAGIAATAAAVRRYRTRIARAPELVYRETPLLAHVRARCAALTEPYRPPWWSANRHLQLALLAWRDARTPPLRYDETERLTLPDGGTVSLDWLGLEDPPATPLVVVLPTICGDGQSMRRTVRAFRRRLGWRVVVCNRRGHGALPLTAPRVSTLGATADVRAQLARIRARLPAAPLYAVGVSAGSGLLVRYLGEEGLRAPLAAAVAYCPGYDTTRAFHRVHRCYDRYLLGAVRRYFLERHAATLAMHPGWDAAMRSRTIGELHDRQHPFAGFATAEEYHAHTNPMRVADAVGVPLLILNAADDPVCTRANVEEHRGLFGRVPESLLVLTERGSHCAFFEGHWRPRSWAHRLIAEYFTAVHDWTPGAAPSSAATAPASRSAG
ncbi:MAG: alpha/beta fold hydrolase [Deltaproteobacteria bacterium]|nr:alpha/beta fold hydrolase [Deltaproteobacteria bacterium]